jgi:hypothetical protein
VIVAGSNEVKLEGKAASTPERAKPGGSAVPASGDRFEDAEHLLAAHMLGDDALFRGGTSFAFYSRV